METANRSDRMFTSVLGEWAEVFMRRSMHDFMEFTKGSGLSMTQLSTLLRLYYRGGCGVSEIGDHLGVTHAAASQLVERLVQQKLLERAEHPDDRRVRMIALTYQGRQLVEESIEARRLWMEQLTTALTPDEQASIGAALISLTQAAQALEYQKPSQASV